MVCVGRIPQNPLQPCKADHSDVRHVLSFVSLSVCSDPMGEEHHIRRTSRVPPLMVVVSAFDSVRAHAVFLLFTPLLTV